MQKKNILIASFCVTILFLVPFTSISGATIDGLNTKTEIIKDDYVLEEVDESILDKIIAMLNELKININDILLKYSYLPNVEERCQELLNAIDIDIKNDERPICIILQSIIIPCFLFSVFLITISWEFYRLGLYDLAEIFGLLSLPFAGVAGGLYAFVYDLLFQCPEFDLFPPWSFKYETGLNLQTIQNRLPQYDLKIIKELIQSYELNGCFCMQE